MERFDLGGSGNTGLVREMVTSGERMFVLTQDGKRAQTNLTNKPCNSCTLEISKHY